MVEETLSSRQIYQGRAVSLRVDTVKMPGGRKTTREIVGHADCVAIVAVIDSDDVLLVSQFRKPVEHATDAVEVPDPAILADVASGLGALAAQAGQKHSLGNRFG